MHFLMIYAVMLVTFGERLGSILRFSDFEILDFEIFGWYFTSKLWNSPTRRGHNPNMDASRHKLPKKEQNLNMSAPPPRPRRRRALASAAERDDNGLRGPE